MSSEGRLGERDREREREGGNLHLSSDIPPPCRRQTAAEKQSFRSSTASYRLENQTNRSCSATFYATSDKVISVCQPRNRRSRTRRNKMQCRRKKRISRMLRKIDVSMYRYSNLAVSRRDVRFYRDLIRNFILEIALRSNTMCIIFSRATIPRTTVRITLYVKSLLIFL